MIIINCGTGPVLTDKHNAPQSQRSQNFDKTKHQTCDRFSKTEATFSGSIEYQQQQQANKILLAVGLSTAKMCLPVNYLRSSPVIVSGNYASSSPISHKTLLQPQSKSNKQLKDVKMIFELIVVLLLPLTCDL